MELAASWAYPSAVKNPSFRKTFVLRVVPTLVVLLILAQFVPFGRSHENPPVTGEPDWDSPETRALVKRVCFDCHSNETHWPWYANVAPVSWLLQRDVEEAREHLNFSEWDKPQRHADEAAHEVEEGEMPLWFYLPLHPEAKLSDDEKAALIAGLKKTLGERKRR